MEAQGWEVIQLTEAWSEMTFDLNFKANVGRNAPIWRKKKYRWAKKCLGTQELVGS